MDQHAFFIEPEDTIAVEAQFYRQGLPGCCVILQCGRGRVIQLHLNNTREGTDLGLDITHAIERLLRPKQKPDDAAFVAKQPF